MIKTTTVVMALTAACLGLAPVASAWASDDVRAGVAANGQKWPTDGAIRHGMDQIRTLMADALPMIKAGRMDAAGYAKLANRISDQIEQVTADSKLPVEINSRLHSVLAPTIEGVAALKASGSAGNGTARILDGLDGYGRQFNHPGWQPL